MMCAWWTSPPQDPRLVITFERLDQLRKENAMSSRVGDAVDRLFRTAESERKEAVLAAAKVRILLKLEQRDKLQLALDNCEREIEELKYELRQTL